MYKVSYDTREWNSDNFHFHLDVTSQKDHVTGKIRGWFVDKNQADLELRLCDNEGKRNDKIVLSIHRPKLPSMYPSIKNVSLSGFEIDLNDFDKCQKLSISIVDIKNNICIAIPVIFSIFIPLLYIHIPKTAGSTVNKFLLERFASTRSLIHVESKDSWKDRLVSGDVDFISGHLTYKNFMRNSLLNCFNKAITFRDPYQHITSHLSWIRSLSLDENNSRYLAHPEYIQKLSDKLVSCDFTDAKNISSVISGFEQPEHQLLDNTQTRYIRTDVSKMNVDALDVKDSLDNLKSFDFVGIDSNIELFLSDIAVSYGFKPSINGIRENVLSTKFGIDPSRDDIREALEPLIRFDLQLYREIQSDIDFFRAKT
ncbi:hypothetical protein [Amphritea sp.]|uniref:hypothetical protein n=1 Tax=Amphritea sp. TaxID=1872502 RepID=UPI003A909006